jgi:tetratricopeptide (TPR) repeat protein
MKKQQLALVLSGIILFAALFFFGRTIPNKSDLPPAPAMPAQNAASKITTESLLMLAKSKLTADQQNRISQLENSVVRGDVKDQQIHVFNQLATFWGDTMQNQNLGAFYAGEAAKLENSEKKLNFAAQILLESLLAEENPGMQNWLATNAKVLYDQSLKLNPANDSAKIGIGACYMFGNISNNPMEGILTVRSIAEKDSNNLYAQMILGLGDIKSGQYDRAIERFLFVVKKQPDNLEAVFHLAEAYDQKSDKANAIKWYKIAAQMVSVPEAKKEIEQRISALQ